MSNNENQVDAEKVIQSLLRQISEHCQKIAMLEAYIASMSQPQAVENKSN